MAVLTFQLAAPPNQPQATGVFTYNIGVFPVFTSQVRTYALAASPLEPDTAATPITNLGQASVFSRPVLTVSLLIRPEDNGHGFAY